MIKKSLLGDIIVLFIFCVIILFSLFIAGVFDKIWPSSATNNSNVSNSTGRVLIKTQGGEYIYPLDNNRVLEFSGPEGVSILEINEDKIHFVSSPCPDHVCEQMGWAGIGTTRFLACLPNAIIVTVEGDSSNVGTDW